MVTQYILRIVDPVFLGIFESGFAVAEFLQRAPGGEKFAHRNNLAGVKLSFLRFLLFYRADNV